MFGAWRSPVARVLWVHDVAGSNPAVPTKCGCGSTARTGALQALDVGSTPIIRSNIMIQFGFALSNKQNVEPNYYLVASSFQEHCRVAGELYALQRLSASTRSDAFSITSRRLLISLVLLESLDLAKTIREHRAR